MLLYGATGETELVVRSDVDQSTKQVTNTIKLHPLIYDILPPTIAITA